MKHRFIYDIAATDVTGGLGPSMADLDAAALAGTNAPVLDTSGIVAGNGDPKPAEIPTEPTPAPGAVEGVNADGTLQEGYVKNADNTVTKVVPTPADPDPTPIGDEEDYYTVVDKLAGVTVTVDYGDVEPTTPEGTVIRENAIREQAVANWEQTLQKMDPRGYAFLVHRAAGKPEDEFFSNSTNTAYTLPTREQFDDSVDAQTAVYKYDLRSRGLSDDIIDTVVAKAIKDNKLKDVAEAAYGTIEKAQEKELADIERAAKAEEVRMTSEITAITGKITSAIEKEIGFVVPEAKRSEFKQYVLDNMRYDNGKFYVVQELGTETLKNQLEAMLFQYNKGDLSKFIKKAATTQATQRLILGINKNNQGTNKNVGNNNGAVGFLPLANI